jgi:uncharacterized protein
VEGFYNNDICFPLLIINLIELNIKRRKYLMKNPVFRAFLILLIIFGTSLPLFAEVGDLEPTEQFYVADYADVISADTEKYIIETNDVLYDKTGAQVVVATVDFINGAEIEDYTYKLFNNWKIGSAEKNNGVLLLLVIGEENYWAVQGKGLEKTLSSGTLGDLLNEYLEPDFASENYNSGTRKFFDAVLKKLENIYGVTISVNNDKNYSDYKDYNNSENNNDELPFFLAVIANGFKIIFQLFIFFVIIAVIIILVNKSNKKKYGNNYDPNQTQNPDQNNNGENNNNPTIPPVYRSGPYIPPVIFRTPRPPRGGGFWGSGWYSGSRHNSDNKPNSSNRKFIRQLQI